jgi:hypothetical protein
VTAGRDPVATSVTKGVLGLGPGALFLLLLFADGAGGPGVSLPYRADAELPEAEARVLEDGAHDGGVEAVGQNLDGEGVWGLDQEDAAGAVEGEGMGVAQKTAASFRRTLSPATLSSRVVPQESPEGGFARRARPS